MLRAIERGPSRQTAWAVGLAILLHGMLLMAWRAPSDPAPSPPRAEQAVLQAQWLVAAPTASPPARANRPGQAANRATGGQRAPAPITPAPPIAIEARTLSTPDTAAASSAPPRPEPDRAGHTSAPQTLLLSPEALVSSLQRERRWQQQHGDGRRFPDRLEAPGPGDSPGTASLQEGAPGPGGRLARVQGAFGTYCVRLPPPDRPLPEGPAPRLALPGNCP